MKCSHLLFCLLATASLAFGQLDSNSVTVTASRTLSAPPDQVVYSLTISTGLSATLDDVTAALQGSGIGPANLASVGISNSLVVAFPPTQIQQLAWSFSLPVPFSKMKDTLISLGAIQDSIAKKYADWNLIYSFRGTQASQSSQACPLPDLMTDARAKAQSFANVAGLSLGNVLAMSGSTSCLITVKFALLRYQ